MTKVTVVIPVYKVEAYLADCLDSVLGQSLKEIEVICIDDASPDGCPQILDDYAARDPRISVIHLEENMGQGNGRNLGLARASGTYVYFLDSDDMITPDAMEQLYEKAESEELDGIFFDSQAVYDDPALKKRYASYPACRSGNYPKEAVPGLQLFEMMIEQGEWTCYVQRQFWRREFLIREGIDNPVRVEHEDEVFAFKAILAAGRVLYWDRDFFIRRYRADSVMTSPPAPKNFYGYFMDMCYMDRFAHERGISSPAIDRNLARLYEKLDRYWRDLSPEHDLESLFKPGEERNLYYFFRCSKMSWMHYGMLSDALLEAARAADELYIYGAGAIAGQIFRALAMRGFVIDAFLVTGREGNPGALNGRPVLTLEEAAGRGIFADALAGSLVIIAVTDGYRQEIEEALDQYGLPHVYYKDK